MKIKEDGKNIINDNITLEILNKKINAMELQIICLNKQNMELVEANTKLWEKIISMNNLFDLLLKKVNNVIELIKNFK